MGQIFGINGVKEPPYTIIYPTTTVRASQTVPIEIRSYSPIFVAEVPASDDTMNKAFRELADYIGVFSTPKNTQKQALAMTAPVLTGPTKLEMTAPVVTTSNEYMQFVLPFHFTSLEQIPTPTSSSVTIRSIPPRLVAVNRFSGSFSKQFFDDKVAELYEQLLKEDLMKAKETGTEKGERHILPQGITWSYAQYNPPFTIPFLRRNEVWIDLTEDILSERLQKLVQECKHSPNSSSIDGK
eukprot:gene6176-6646_t